MKNYLKNLIGTRFSFYAIASLVAGFVAMGGVWRLQVANLHADLANCQLMQQQGVNTQNAATIEGMQKDKAAAGAALAGDGDDRVASAEKSTKLKEEVKHAKPTDDDLIAPVLLRAFDGLRLPAAAVSAIQPGTAKGAR